MPPVLGIVNGAIPPPHRALVQPQLLEGRGFATPYFFQRIFLADRGQERRVHGDTLREELEGPPAYPAVAKGNAGRSPVSGRERRAVVDGLPEERDARFLPKQVLEKEWRVPGDRQHRTGCDLRGV